MANPIQNLRDVWQRTGIVQRVVLITVVLACVGAAVLLVRWANQPSMALLYSGLDPEEASRIVGRLRDSDCPYELKSGGTTIYVPEENVYAMRLEMAGQGLPLGDNRGYRILDEERIGTSPLIQRANYRRAIEGELAQTIQLMEGIVSARVHIVQPTGGMFSGDETSPTATTALRLRPGCQLSATNVAAIVHLVAGSVEGLKPDKVVVVDNSGNLLSGESREGFAKGVGSFLEYKSRVEEYLAKKAEDMLKLVLGPDRATVRVDATIVTTSTNQTTETYDPEKKVITKEELTTKSVTGGTAAAAEPAASGSGDTKEETVISEYNVSKTVEELIEMPGTVKSLTVAVCVDLSPPTAPPAAEGEAATPPPTPTIKETDVEEIVRNALGLKQTDTITLVSTPFNRPPVAETETEDDEAYETRQFYLEIAQRGSLGVLVVGALVALKLFSGKRKKGEAVDLTQALQGQPAGPGRLLPGAGATADTSVLRHQIASALKENPEEVKRLFLAWVAGGKGEA